MFGTSAGFVSPLPTKSYFDSSYAISLSKSRCIYLQTTKRTTRLYIRPSCVAAGVTGEGDRWWSSSSASSSAPGSSGGSDDDENVTWETICGCPTALPVSGAPEGVVHLLGGLGACAAPERFYNRLVAGVASTANVAVVCVPLPAVPGLDHENISRNARARIDAVLSEIRIRYGPRLQSVAMGHSLGSRLQTIHASRARSLDDVGVVLLSFSNGDARAAVAGADGLREALSGGAASMVGDALQRAAENVRGSIGETLRAEAAKAAAKVEQASARAKDALENMEFIPDKRELLKWVGDGYDVKRTLVIRYDRDSLDNSEELVKAIRERNGEKAVVTRLLQGTHVTPFTLKMGEVMMSTGIEMVDQGLKSLRREVDSEIDQTVNTVGAFVKLIIAEANAASSPQLNASD